MADRRRQRVRSTSRVLVVSDCHAYPDLITNALTHFESKYGSIRDAADRVIFAGDFLDRGTFAGARQCLRLIDELADEVLWGNHDIAALVRYEIRAQRKSSYRFSPALRERLGGTGDMRKRAGKGAPWELVTSVGDVLLSHAGLSKEYADDLSACNGELGRLTDLINREFDAALGKELDTGDWKTRTRNSTSPAHYKLAKHGLENLLPGVIQVVGHTPPEMLVPGEDDEMEGRKRVRSTELTVEQARSGEVFSAHGLYLMDPHAKDFKARPRKFRYAVIEDGTPRIEEGELP